MHYALYFFAGATYPFNTKRSFRDVVAGETVVRGDVHPILMIRCSPAIEIESDDDESILCLASLSDSESVPDDEWMKRRELWDIRRTHTRYLERGD